MKITFIFSCSGMFRHVPECSGMFRNVPCSWFYRRPTLGGYYTEDDRFHPVIWNQSSAVLWLSCLGYFLRSRFIRRLPFVISFMGLQLFMQVHLDYTSCRANRPINLFSLVFSCVLFYSLGEMCCYYVSLSVFCSCYQSGQSGYTVLEGLDWTGLDWTGLVKRGLRIGSCGRLFFFQIFSAFVNRIKLNGEQTFTKTNLRLKIMFIYFQAVLFRRFSERNNPLFDLLATKGVYMRQLQTI